MRLIMFAYAGIVLAQAPSADRPTPLVYFWVPRTEDVGSGAADIPRATLQFLVEHAAARDYVVTPADVGGLDDIIRIQFLVSRKNYPNAYKIYLANILKRNPGLSTATVLHPKDVLKIPGGPKFAGLELKGRTSELLYRAELQRSLALRSIGTTELNERAAKALGAYTRSAKAALTGAVQYVRTAAAELGRRQLLPANTEAFHKKESVVPTENVPLVEVNTAALPSFVRQRAAMAFLPASEDEEIDCSNGCRSCRELLPATAVMIGPKSRLLIADSGFFDPKLARVVYTPPGEDGRDLDPKFHGSFVYSEVVNTFSGVLDPQIVEVAKIAVKRAGTYAWSIGDLKAAFDDFGRRLDRETLDVNRATRGPVWVVNVSAGGPSELTDAIPNVFTASSNILLVASAGNGRSGTRPEQELFPAIQTASANLLIVGALDRNDSTLAPYSNFHHHKVDLFVRGSCVCGRVPQRNGTSQAAPIVSVAATILAARYPNWNPLEVKWRLISSSDITPEVSACFEASRTPRCGVGGVLNLKRALDNTTTIVHATKDSSGGVSMHEDHVDDANWTERLEASWSKLLGVRPMAEHQVLRLHRVACDPDFPGFVCFQQLALGAEPEPAFPVRLPPLTVPKNGSCEHIAPEDIQDVFLTLVPKES